MEEKDSVSQISKGGNNIDKVTGGGAHVDMGVQRRLSEVVTLSRELRCEDWRGSAAWGNSECTGPEVGAPLVSSGQPMRSQWLGQSAYCKERWLEVGPERWHEVSLGPSRISWLWISFRTRRDTEKFWAGQWYDVIYIISDLINEAKYLKMCFRMMRSFWHLRQQILIPCIIYNDIINFIIQGTLNKLLY